MNFLLILICLCVFIAANQSWVNAECCSQYITSEHECKENRESGCTTKICKDGTPLLTTFCGYGSCNIFGCNCGNGCRNNNLDSWQEAHNIFLKNYFN